MATACCAEDLAHRHTLTHTCKHTHHRTTHTHTHTHTHTLRCVCTCTLCNDNKLNPIQSNANIHNKVTYTHTHTHKQREREREITPLIEQTTCRQSQLLKDALGFHERLLIFELNSQFNFTPPFCTPVAPLGLFMAWSKPLFVSHLQSQDCV